MRFNMITAVMAALILIQAVLATGTQASAHAGSLPGNVDASEDSGNVSVFATSTEESATRTRNTYIPSPAGGSPQVPSCEGFELPPLVSCEEWHKLPKTQNDWLPLPPGHPHSPAPAPSASSRAETETIVRSALLTMQLPAPEIGFDPDPSVNEWNAWAVYLPLWLVTNQTTHNQTITENAITITIDAVPASTTFAMGDDTTVTCRTTTPRPARIDPWEPSPTCGHTYTMPGSYTVTATTNWKIAWSANGHTGTLTTTTSSSRALQVSEFSSIIID